MQFLNHRFLYICSFLSLLSHSANLFGPILVVGVQARVVVRQLPEGSPRRRLNLERLKFLKCMALVHPLNDGVNVSYELLSEHLGILRKNLWKSDKKLRCVYK